MKTRFCLLLTCLVQTAFCQGTLQFRARLLPIPTAPSTTRGGSAFLELRGNEFTAGASIQGTFGIGYLSFAQIENAAGDIQFPTIWLTGGCASSGGACSANAAWPNIPITDSEIAVLMNGGLFVRVGLEQFPEEIFLGQLQLVPEPTTWTLFLFSGMLFTAFSTHRFKKVATA